MKRKTTLLFYVLLGVILLSSAVAEVAPPSNSGSACTSYLTDYLEKTDAFEDARDSLVRAKVATAKASPTGNVPPEWSEFEAEYDANTNDYFSNLKVGLTTHPNSPSNITGLLTGLSQSSHQLQLMQVEAAAAVAYDAALAAQEAAERALAQCQGMSIVTIWCERGALCNMTPGVSGNPRAHYVSDCPDEVEGAFNLNVGCPGSGWWKCDGKNVCPRSSDHVVPCKGGCGDLVGPDRVERYHLRLCESNMAFIGCGQRYRSCSATDKALHAFNGGRCAQLPPVVVRVRGACGDIYDANSSSAHSHRPINFSCGSHRYFACQPPSQTETQRHAYQRLPCGNHSGRPCKASSRHTTSVSCPQNNGRDCNLGSYYPCSKHSHVYPSANTNTNNNGVTGNAGNAGNSSQTVSCGRSACTDSVSSSTEHRVGPCSACSASYWSCGSSATWSENQHRTRTCRRSGCGNTWQRCTSSTPSCNVRSGRSCWAR